MWHYMGYGGMGFGLLILIIIIFVVIWIANRLIPSNQSQKQSPGPLEHPLDILKRRYARGDINKEQYDQMKKDLE